MRSIRWISWLVLAILALVCILRGQTGIAAMSHPPDQDILRDVGFMQAILDGNWWGDPVYPGETRWYPPLIPAIGAALAWLAGADPAHAWLVAGPWLTLAAAASFVAMAARLLDLTQAVAAVAVFVLVDSAIGRPWVTGGYTPWAFTPTVSAGLFFGAVWLIHGAARRLRWRDAIQVGLALGIVALAHTVPALLLSAIAAAAVLSSGGFRLRTVGWLAVVAALQVGLMVPYVLPLWLHYRLQIANPIPGGYVTDLLRPEFLWFAGLFNLAGAAAAGAALLLRRQAPLRSPTAAILVAWIAASAVMLGRHYACHAADLGRACAVFQVAAHHWQLYLTFGWTLVAAHAVVAVARLRTSGQNRVRERATTVLTAIAAGVGFVLAAGIGDPTAATRNPTQDIADWASLPGRETDWPARDWIRAHTPADATFVTDGSDAAAFTVIPAGRALVAAPRLHANPYVDWPDRESRRRALLAALTLSGSAGSCGQEAGWALLPTATPVASNRAESVFHTALNTIWRLRGADCPQ